MLKVFDYIDNKSTVYKLPFLSFAEMAYWFKDIAPTWTSTYVGINVEEENVKNVWFYWQEKHSL